MKPVIAIVGRPNVGKSTLLNRLAGRAISLVVDTPGVTRDRIYAQIRLASGVDVLLIDTGGLDPAPQDQIEISVVEQAYMAIEEADHVLFVCDVKDGLHPFDKTIATTLIKSGKSNLCLVNKCDPGASSRDIWEFYQTGLEIMPISATHGAGFSDLEDHLASRFAIPAGEESFRKDIVFRMSMLGRPNVGKSSLVNCLAGSQRQLVSDVPGTTRDAVDIEIEHPKGPILLVDTPGVRRKKKIKAQMERLSVLAALKSIERSDVVVVVLDVTENMADQDARLMSLVHERGKGLIVVVNKTDLFNAQQNKTFLEELKYKMRFVSYAPVMKVSALTGHGVGRIIKKAADTFQSAQIRISTGRLNKFLADAVGTLEPPSVKGKRAKLSYMTQASVQPPTFIVWVNNPDLVPVHYRRYLENRLRKQEAFLGTPLRWIYRKKRQKL